jgi:hypothetical protein
VDEDDNNPDVRSYYTLPLAALKATVTVLDTEPNASQLALNESVIWFTGDNYAAETGPSPTMEGVLAQWLDAGGCLFITSADYAYVQSSLAPDANRADAQSSQAPNIFMQNYLGVSTIVDDVGQTWVNGTGTLFSGYGPYSLVMPTGYTANYSDIIIPADGASAAFLGTTNPAAVFYEHRNFKTTYWGFPFDAIPGLQDRVELLKRFLYWCRYYDIFLPVISR